MIVVANTTPLNHLILIGQEELLSKLYTRLIIPNAVLEELQASRAPRAVKHWIANHPRWLQVARVITPVDPALEALDPGEREVIVLAHQTKADLVIMDDRGGRREAQRRGLCVIGTLNVLYAAAQRRWIEDFPGVMQQLRESGFRVSSKLYQLLLERYASERKLR